MPTLNWIGKDKVINHHLDVPYKVLDKQYSYNTDKESENKIIHGDNLEALKSLLPEYEGKVKCIYIDPPYNTGNENWVYNDNVNDPKIKKWLGEVVGKESEDLTRHDKWLCMMYPRLKLLHRLLADDGAIFISIDDNEHANLKLICDEIFGSKNFVTNFIWERKKKPAFLSRQVGSITEYIFCYAKRYDFLESFTSVNHKTTKGKKYPLNNSGNGIKVLKFPPNSVFFGMDNIVIKAQDMSEGNIITRLLNDVSIVEGKNENEFELEGEWRYSQLKLDEIIKNNEKLIISKVPFRPNHIKSGDEDKKIHNFLSYRTYEIETNEDASNELINIFGNKEFDFSKPKKLIEFLLSVSTDEDSIILDSFAGSGTTAHAVLNLNKEDGGNRKFILIEMEDYANTITAERVKRVIKGYGEDKKAVEGTNGDFTYYQLGESLFLENDFINENLPIEEILSYIWYVETNSHYKKIEEKNQYLLGLHGDASYYFYYDKENLTTLNLDFLNTITKKTSTYVIYADNCVLPKDFLTKNNIIFKKIPRDITRF